MEAFPPADIRRWRLSGGMVSHMEDMEGERPKGLWDQRHQGQEGQGDPANEQAAGSLAPIEGAPFLRMLRRGGCLGPAGVGYLWQREDTGKPGR
jgi:hypothetical protein